MDFDYKTNTFTLEDGRKVFKVDNRFFYVNDEGKKVKVTRREMEMYFYRTVGRVNSEYMKKYKDGFLFRVMVGLGFVSGG